jgi:hypothetical protein
VPRTACRTVFKYLKEELGLEGATPTHNMQVPEGSESYHNFTVVRNPYSRLVSCWGWYRRAIVNKDNKPFQGRLFVTVQEEWEDFAQTIRAAVEHHPRLGNGFGNFRTQRQYLQQLEDLDLQHLRFEHLAQDLYTEVIKKYKPEAIPPAKLSHNSETNYRSSWQEFYRNQEIIDIAHELMGDDFEYCGYEKGIDGLS